jgi:HSP20 family protein
MESNMQRDGDTGTSRTIKVEGAGREAANEASRNKEGPQGDGGSAHGGEVRKEAPASEAVRSEQSRAGSASGMAGANGPGQSGQSDQDEAGKGTQRRWNPFMFERDEESGKLQREQGSGRRAMELAPRDAFQFLLSEPFRMMQEFMRFPFGGSADPDRWFGDFRPATLQPQIDVVDSGDAVSVTAELPGIKKEDLEVMVDDNALILRGEKRHDSRSREEGCYRIERAFGRFQRRIPLPDNVDPSRAEARFEDAVLNIRIPKSSQPRRQRRIDISG